MFRFLFRKPQAKSFRIFYTCGSSHFYQQLVVKANSMYEALRIFDTEMEPCFTRRGAEEIVA
ncbi:hypothetical protein SynSYN20_01594 [Synechococcus sp. SYN20]|uniref:hypothetical protein n=1 Tax=Synechococcus sp. SYN20 TaxID=1050714 RepID=UPI00164504EA|nr:hypothetical protein [Synechococcus sp. SYN20]QNJ25921.1 hypothetical protein SynSYN20_01594 [Synechococcus sp. SYN20]